MAIFLSFKEVWRNKGRFLLFSLVIALITTLVLFVAGLAEGLAQANKQYLESINAQLLVYQDNVDLSISASRLTRGKVNAVSRVEGVYDAGPVGFSSSALVAVNGKPVNVPNRDNLNVSLIGILPGEPGVPEVLQGRNLSGNRGDDVLVDQNLANRLGVGVGDVLRIRSTQGTRDEIYELRVAGITKPLQYLYAPSIFLPYRTFDNVRPQATAPSSTAEMTPNVIAVQLKDPSQIKSMAGNIMQQVDGVEVADIRTAYESLPGYSAQQGTLDTQQAFVLLIGILVIGGFFQIQVLQKVPQIGVLKAIGTSNRTVAAAVVFQIILVTTFGVLLGGLVTLGLAFGIPPVVPIQFSGASVLLAIAALLAIGPIGGLVSVRLAISVEPLIALGLNS
jgi:putative ABC transport system permease protein